MAVEYFDAAEEDKKFAFKCHRRVVDGVDTAFPVNAIAFHPVYGTLATGGADGYVLMWDPQKKRRICQFPKYPATIASLAFSPDGARLAIAASYTWENGDKQHAPDAIYVRTLSDADVKPKVK